MKLLGNRINFSVLSIFIFSAAAFMSGAVQAAQTQALFKTVYRYDPNTGLKTGVISPDADTDQHNFLAQRYIYGDSARPTLVTEIQSGNLYDWLSEDKEPKLWANYTTFTIYSTQGFEYDSYGRKLKEWVKDKDLNFETVTQYSYNAKGLIECKAQRMNKASFSTIQLNACTPDAVSSEGPDRITRYAYDDLDQVLTETKAYGTTLQQVYVTNTYEGYLLKTQTDANGNKTQLDYDPMYGRLTYRYYPSPTATGSVNYSDYNQYHYDLNGNMDWERKRNGTEITYTIDNNNRVSIKNYNTAQRDIYYQYDLRGLQTRAAFGTSISNSELVTADRTEQKYDGFGNLTKDLVFMNGVGRAMYGKYDAHNNRNKVTHNDTSTYFTYEYDNLDRLGVIYEGAGTRMLQIDYQVDGHRKRIYRRGGVSSTNYSYLDGVRLDGFTQDFPNNAYDLTNTFQYNAASQVTQLTQSNSLYYYTGSDDRKGNYTPDGLNRYKFVGGATQGIGTPIYYDDNSNLKDDGTLTYQYDDENRLISTGGTVSSVLTYDPRGRLFQSNINGNVTQFLYYGDALTAEYSSSGVMQRRYVHGDRVDEPLVQYNSSTLGLANWIYLHADHQGSIIAQSDVNGVVKSTSSYDAYGIPRSGNNDRFGYTGQTWLKELGLWYYKARVYHPKLGRFLQTDPIGYKDDMDLYSYVGNDPINKTDPKGLYSCNGSGGECKQFANDLKVVKAAIKSGEISKSQAAGLTKVVNTLGTSKQTNGITVSFGTTKTGGNAEAGLAGTDASNNKGTLVIDPAKRQGEVAAGAAIAHEVDHLITRAKVGASTTRAAEFKDEQSAYGISAAVYEGNEVPGTYSQGAIDRAAEASTVKWCEAIIKSGATGTGCN